MNISSPLDMDNTIPSKDNQTNLPSLHPVIALHCSAGQVQVLKQNRPYFVTGHGLIQPGPK